MASRLIPSSKFDDEILIESMINAMLDSDFGQILAVTPYACKECDGHGTSINPAWRDAVWHVSTPLIDIFPSDSSANCYLPVVAYELPLEL